MPLTSDEVILARKYLLFISLTSQPQEPEVVLIGDAAHPMSPFKGQVFLIDFGIIFKARKLFLSTINAAASIHHYTQIALQTPILMISREPIRHFLMQWRCVMHWCPLA
jgi:fructose-specific component phosphotransferase system IIB-like protein